MTSFVVCAAAAAGINAMRCWMRRAHQDCGQRGQANLSKSWIVRRPPPLTRYSAYWRENCMLKLKANFEADWMAHLRAELTNIWGAEIACIPDGDLATYFFETLHRRLRPMPRALKISDDFQRSPAQLAGWQALQNKVAIGGDLNPHLSTRHASLRNPDGLLAEWGVHHFHLGTTPDTRTPGYVQRRDFSTLLSVCG